MEIIRKIIRAEIGKLFENVQLADKVYFNSGKLSPKIKEIIIDKITHGDNYTKIVTDIYWAYLQQSVKQGNWAIAAIDGKDYDFPDEAEVENDMLQLEQWKEIKGLYQELKEYNKNVYPIEGLDIYNTKDIWNVIGGLKQRRKIIDHINKLPSVAVRNMKNDIRQPRTYSELQEYRSKLDYFMSHFAMLSNRDEKMQIKVLQKMFKKDTTLDDLYRFVDDKESFLGGAEFTKDDVKRMAEEEDFEVIYEQGDVMIVRVDSPDGIKKIGCNSLWCFTYGSGFDSAYQQWNSYSHNDQVYVIIDFKEKTDSQDFMHVLIKPLINEGGELEEYSEELNNEEEIPLFNMANENYYNPYSILKHLFGENYKDIIYKYLNFEY